MADPWIREYQNGMEYLEHRDGIDWALAPMPPRRHRCAAQTRGLMLGGYIERCACGAASLGSGIWIERNSPQNSRPRVPTLTLATVWRRWYGGLRRRLLKLVH